MSQLCVYFYIWCSSMFSHPPSPNTQTHTNTPQLISAVRSYVTPWPRPFPPQPMEAALILCSVSSSAAAASIIYHRGSPRTRSETPTHLQAAQEGRSSGEDESSCRGGEPTGAAAADPRRRRHDCGVRRRRGRRCAGR